MNSNFYNELLPFTNFDNFNDIKNYKSIPDDWIIFVADIEGSTKAIDAGEYKNVNLVGAAVISFCVQALTPFDFPYVFGGDGASLCVPPEHSAAIEKELAELKYFSEREYKLKLRVSKIPVREVLKDNFSVLVAKYEITDGRSIAFFKGGGLDHADFIGKKFHKKYKVDMIKSSRFLDGITCRWNSIPTTKGTILSILVKSKTEDDISLYSSVVDKINSLTDGSYNPVKKKQMKYKSFFKGLREDTKMHSSIWSKDYLNRVIQYLVCYVAFKLNYSPFFEAKTYTDSIASHSDYRKFDDTLRMIIDCTLDQKNEIREYLTELKENIYFGIHESDAALMTCFVESIKPGEHIHFIDGSDGGYAIAAKEMKAQMLQA